MRAMHCGKEEVKECEDMEGGRIEQRIMHRRKDGGGRLEDWRERRERR